MEDTANSTIIMDKSDSEAHEEVLLVEAPTKVSINGGAWGRNIHLGVSIYTW